MDFGSGISIIPKEELEKEIVTTPLPDFNPSIEFIPLLDLMLLPIIEIITLVDEQTFIQ